MDNKSTFQLMSEFFPRMMHNILKDFSSPTGNSLGLNKTQIHSLIKIRKLGKISMGGLCYHIGLTKGSMTTIIDMLVERGYVIRQRAEDDRRRVLVTLSEEGERLAETCRDEVSQQFDRQLENLSEEDQQIFRSSVESIHTIFDKMENQKQ